MNNKAILKTVRSKSDVKLMFRPKVNITRIVARREEAMESMAFIRYNLLEKFFCQFISSESSCWRPASDKASVYEVHGKVILIALF